MKRATTVARQGDCNAVNLYIHDGAASFRFEIEGSLSGNAATQVEQAWCTASSVIGDRSLVVAIGNLTNIDSSGRKLLRNWHEAGAFFVAKSPLTKTLIGSIVGQPVMTANTFDGRSWLRTCALPLIPLFTLFFPPKLNAASLEPTTSEAWENYVDSASKRMEQRLRPGSAFLWVDEVPERLARVRAGETVLSPVGPEVPKRVPSGLIHDWVGAVFIPNVTLKDVLQVARDYGRYKELYQPTVIASKAIATTEAKDRFSMVLISTSYLPKTALDADYESCYVHVDDRRAYSVTRATRIQEIEEYGSPNPQILREGEGNGIIWKLFSITRYFERDGGVYLEFEAIGLSRDIPASLRWIVEPIVRRISRGSLSTSLQQTAQAVSFQVEAAKRNKSGGEWMAASAHRAPTTQNRRAPIASR
ncbi:MAG: hypothetical protein WBW33_22125 [Bryobacteraceae bacterium]